MNEQSYYHTATVLFGNHLFSCHSTPKTYQLKEFIIIFVHNSQIKYEYSPKKKKGEGEQKRKGGTN